MEGVGFGDHPSEDFPVISGHCCVVENACISPPIFKLRGSPSSKEAGEERRGRSECLEGGERPRRECRALHVGEGETTVTNSPWVNYLLVCPCHSLVY